MIPLNTSALPAQFQVPLCGHHLREDRDSECLPTTLTEFMLSESRSSYTSFISTNNAAKLVQIDFHCHRLIAGLKALEPNCRLPTSAQLKTVLKNCIASIARRTALPPHTEVQFVVVLRCADFEPYLRVHAALVPSVRLDQIAYDSAAVECRKGQRLRPGVKDTSWYHERVPFERARKNGVKETILVGEDDKGIPVLLEGLVTNFFVVTDDHEVWTAEEELVLSGSMRNLVLRVCEQLNVTVVEQAVPLPSWRKYQAAFLTNARRYLQPVSIIEVPICFHEGFSDIPDIIRLPNAPTAVDLVQNLRQQITLLIESTAEDISPA